MGYGRSSDQPRVGREVMRDRDGNVVPDALVRCRLAIELHKAIARDKLEASRYRSALRRKY
jgi:hypothetical protein